VVGLYVDRHGEGDDFQVLKQLLKKAGQIEEERNRIIHSIWGAGSSADKITRMKVTCRDRRGFGFQSQEYDEAQFIAFNTRIKELTSALQQLYIDLLKKGKVVSNPVKKMW